MISTSHVTTAEHDETPFFWVVGGWAGGGGRRCGGFSERESGEEFFSSFLRRRKRRSSDAIERRSLNLFSFTRRSLLAFSPFNFPTSIFWMAPEWKPRSKKKRWARKGPKPNEVNIWSSNSKERASSRRPPDSKSPHASPPPLLPVLPAVFDWLHSNSHCYEDTDMFRSRMQERIERKASQKVSQRAPFLSVVSRQPSLVLPFSLRETLFL